jgi:hypothetical protein
MLGRLLAEMIKTSLTTNKYMSMSRMVTKINKACKDQIVEKVNTSACLLPYAYSY